jgi:hypothetical protein
MHPFNRGPELSRVHRAAGLGAISLGVDALAIQKHVLDELGVGVMAKTPAGEED